MRPGGKVLAVDIQPEMLAMIRDRMKERGVTNIDLIQGKITDPLLPAQCRRPDPAGGRLPRVRPPVRDVRGDGTRLEAGGGLVFVDTGWKTRTSRSSSFTK